MMKNVKTYGRRLLAFVLAAVVAFGTAASGNLPVYAADGTLTFNSGETLAYGEYYTTKMTFDGENTAYCLEPMKSTPSAGKYEYELLAKDSPIRKALFYLPGGYGYDKYIKEQYLDGWSEDNAYVIGHLTVAFIHAGYDENSGAFYGAPQNYIDKAKEVADVISGLPAPPENFKAFIIPHVDNQTIAGSWYQEPNGYIEIIKSSSCPDLTNGNASYSLNGAQYGVYLGSKLIETLTTDKKGYAKSGELEADQTYTVKELKASKGFAVDPQSYNVEVKSEVSSSLKVEEPPHYNPLDLLLQKIDCETKESTPQGAASLAGAQFTMKFYAEQSDTDPAKSGKKPIRTWIFQTNAAGELHYANDFLVSGDALYYQADGQTPCIPLGTVTLMETKSPAGYLESETIFVQKISEDGDQETVSVYNASTVEEQVYRGGVAIQKRDLETKEAKAQGGASLEKAEFTITTLNDNPVLVNGEVYTKDQVVLTLKTNKEGLATTEKDALPYGHYRADEITPPDGYLNSGKLSIEFDITEDGKIVQLTDEDHSILNQVKRGDLEFVKVSDGDHNRLANVPFTITSKTTGEAHTLVTDKNGYASTASKWNKHTSNTNRGETSEDGIWFGTSEPDDGKGALIYDSYTIKEQRCNANEGLSLIKFDVTIYKDSTIVDLGTLTDDQIVIATTALDAETESHMSQAAKSVTIEDTVSYEGLKRGTEYKVTGTLMDAETGNALLIDGKPVTSETTFTAKKSTGSAKVAFTFDATGLNGRAIVVFEELYQDDLKLAVHADLTDTDQTIFFPEIGTTALDSDTKTNLSCADEEVTLIDTMTYKGLIPGETYQVLTTLMDKETGKPVEVDGKEVTAATKFKPEKSTGTTDITFTFDGSVLKGKTVVIFESVTYKGKEVAAHADIEDQGQTIYFPELLTTASDTQTGTNQGTAASEVTIKDQVEYRNLIAGKEYLLTGTLMLQDTEKPLEIDSKPVTSELVFTPEETSGSVELTFKIDGSALKGQTTVVFESLTTEEKQVAVHADISDEKQSVYFPQIGTSAKDGKDGDQDVLADKEVTIVDTVTYKHLIAGASYKIKGLLMDKETKKPLEIDGKQVTAEAEFSPEKSDGTIDVTFTFNGSSLAGHAVVVFEKLYYINGEKEIEITSHEDITDEGQTVKFTDTPKKESPAEKPSSSAPVKTGDDSNQMVYILLAAAAGVVLLGTVSYLAYKRKKRNLEE